MAVVVVGGTVLDIQAKPTADELQRGSSVPGSVVQLPGGVGRNIAEAAQHLLQGASALLISVIGHDTAADALLASFAHLGLSTQGILRSPSVSTPCVVAVLDRGGEVAASVADVAAPAALLTPAVMQQHAPDIAAAQLLILDANLQPATLEAAAGIATAAEVPVLFEPVSVPKAPRCVPVLHRIAAITPNANELLAIADVVQQQRGLPPLRHPAPVSPGQGGASLQQTLAQLAPAAALVLQQGVRCIILTMGHLGAALLTLSKQASEWPSQQVHHSNLHHQQQHHSNLHHQQQHQAQQKGRKQASRLSSSAALLLKQRPHSQAQAEGLPGRVCVRAQHIPAAAATVVNLSGAGDTLTGGLAAALVRGCDLLHALAVGVAAAGVSVQCALNVPGRDQGCAFEDVEQAGRRLLAQQQVWEFPVQSSL